MRRKLAAILAVVMTLNISGTQLYADGVKAGEISTEQSSEMLAENKTTEIKDSGTTGADTTGTKESGTESTESTEITETTETQELETEKKESTETIDTTDTQGSGTKSTESTEVKNTEDNSTEKIESTETTEGKDKNTEKNTDNKKEETDTEETDTEETDTEKTDKAKLNLLEDDSEDDLEDEEIAKLFESAEGLEALPDDPQYIKEVAMRKASGLMANTYDSMGAGYIHNDRYANSTVRNGIDVSYYQGDIDWNAVKNSGVEFAFVRVGYRGYSNGRLVEDPKFRQNLAGAANAGIKVGAYVFSQAINAGEAREEAEFALSKIAGYNVTMPIAMDYEYINGPSGRLYDAHLTREQATEAVNAFGAKIMDRGYMPVIYANRSMLESSLNAGNIYYKVWLANYTTKTLYQGNYDFWQYSSSGSISGINGRVDCNFWYDFDSPRYSQTVADGIYRIETAAKSGMALDINNASRNNNGNLQLWEQNNRSAQDFKVTYLGDGKYSLMAMCSGNYIDVEGGGSNNGTNISQYAWTGGDNQKWYIQDAGNGYYYIRSAASQKCLDVKSGSTANGTNIQLWEKNDSSSQKFKFTKTGYEKTLKNGTYMIKAEADSNMVFDVAGESLDNSANIDLWENKDAANQKFTVKYIGSGLYTISAKHSRKYMDAERGGTSPGTNILQYEGNNGANQKWYIKDAGQGYYSIVSSVSGLYVEIGGGAPNMGSNIQLWDGNGRENQRFRFETVTQNAADGNGWHYDNGKKYWYDNGVMARDKEVYDPDSDAWYWFDADGTMAADKDVFIPTNSERTQGKWVRYDEDGGMIKNEDYRYNGWYWFDPTTGEMIKGFVNIPVSGDRDGKWVYYDDVTGQMHHGESCINGNWYYFDDATGKMVHGEYKRNGNWYYYDHITGIMSHGWTTLPNGTRRYYDEVTGILR